MAAFGDLFRGIEDHDTRLNIFGSLLDLRRGDIRLKLIGTGKSAEVYEIVPGHEIHPKLVVKTPPFRLLHDPDAFDAGCFSILQEMEALCRIGSCAFVNMAQDAKSVFDVPALVFKKMDTDLRQLVTTDVTAGDLFVRLAVLHMIARGLTRAQEKGVIIHQDLKPENILLDYVAVHYDVNDEFPALAIPKINDFEFTNRIVGERLRGFRPYLAAEHYAKDNVELGENNRYDIYSLAIIAHELLTFGFHPIFTSDDSRGLHCSAFVNGLEGPYKNEEKWKKFARLPSFQKPLAAISDRVLAATLSAALDPEFMNRPTSAEMADAFWNAMAREDKRSSEQIGITIDYLEEAGEIGSGAQAAFPARARRIIDQSPIGPMTY